MVVVINDIGADSTASVTAIAHQRLSPYASGGKPWVASRLATTHSGDNFNRRQWRQQFGHAGGVCGSVASHFSYTPRLQLDHPRPPPTPGVGGPVAAYTAIII